jgi:hypothetical protein
VRYNVLAFAVAFVATVPPAPGGDLSSVRSSTSKDNHIVIHSRPVAGGTPGTAGFFFS